LRLFHKSNYTVSPLLKYFANSHLFAQTHPLAPRAQEKSRKIRGVSGWFYKIQNFNEIMNCYAEKSCLGLKVGYFGFKNFLLRSILEPLGPRECPGKAWDFRFAK